MHQKKCRIRCEEKYRMAEDSENLHNKTIFTRIQDYVHSHSEINDSNPNFSCNTVWHAKIFPTVFTSFLASFLGGCSAVFPGRGTAENYNPIWWELSTNSMLPLGWTEVAPRFLGGDHRTSSVWSWWWGGCIKIH